MSEQRAKKPVAASKTERSFLLMPAHINGQERLFGGLLMEWIDVTAGIAARRHAECNVTTACVDSLVFQAPAYSDELLVQIAQLTYVGHSSMEVRVDSFVEALDGTRERVNRAYLVLVAIGADGKPKEVPELILETDEERAEYEAAKNRDFRRRHNR